MNEIAWIGSVLGIGGLIGTILVGWIADRIGRKNSLLALAVPQIVSSMLISNLQVSHTNKLHLHFFYDAE